MGPRTRRCAAARGAPARSRITSRLPSAAGSMPSARSRRAAGGPGSPASPRTGCRPCSARWLNTRWTTVQGLYVSGSAAWARPWAPLHVVGISVGPAGTRTRRGADRGRGTGLSRSMEQRRLSLRHSTRDGCAYARSRSTPRCGTAAVRSAVRRRAARVAAETGDYGGTDSRDRERDPATEDLVAEDRLRFLTAEPLDPRHVRGAILASWQRSRDLERRRRPDPAGLHPRDRPRHPPDPQRRSRSCGTCASSWTASRSASSSPTRPGWC